MKIELPILLDLAGLIKLRLYKKKKEMVGQIILIYMAHMLMS